MIRYRVKFQHRGYIEAQMHAFWQGRFTNILRFFACYLSTESVCWEHGSAKGKLLIANCFQFKNQQIGKFSHESKMNFWIRLTRVGIFINPLPVCPLPHLRAASVNQVSDLSFRVNLPRKQDRSYQALLILGSNILIPFNAWKPVENVPDKLRIPYILSTGIGRQSPRSRSLRQ